MREAEYLLRLLLRGGYFKTVICQLSHIFAMHLVCPYRFALSTFLPLGRSTLKGALVPEGSQEGGVRGGSSCISLLYNETLSLQSPPNLPLLGGGNAAPVHHKRLMQQLCIFLPLGAQPFRGACSRRVSRRGGRGFISPSW